VSMFFVRAEGPNTNVSEVTSEASVLLLRLRQRC
jgi:hypothetical protein